MWPRLWNIPSEFEDLLRNTLLPDRELFDVFNRKIFSSKKNNLQNLKTFTY
jgi:hypothetical protein